jgi:hypothetical protein
MASRAKKVADAVRLIEAIESGDAAVIGTVATTLIVENNPKYAAEGALISFGLTRLLKRASGEGGGWLSRLFGG